MAKILFVVHRYAPYPGGSETNVKNMAEEMLRRGHDVSVVAQTHQGDYNGVAVHGDHSLVYNSMWDLIIVHGGDVPSQNFVHAYYDLIKSPVLYLIIKPSESELCLQGLHQHKYLGWGTSFDLELIKKYGLEDKARQIRYGLPLSDTVFPDSMLRSTPERKVFISIGGFAPHKQMRALYDAFNSSDIDGRLILLGYDASDVPTNTSKVTCGVNVPKKDLMCLVEVSDALIMNSSEEGFGLVLLEAMFNKTPWFAKDIAGAHDMAFYGTIYNDEAHLMELLKEHDKNSSKTQAQIQAAYDYVMNNHRIEHCVNDIEKVLNER